MKLGRNQNYIATNVDLSIIITLHNELQLNKTSEQNDMIHV